MIDYFLRFTSRAEAKADPDIRAFHHALDDRFDDAQIIVNPDFWRHSQDVVTTDGEGNEVRTHNYIAGFVICVSLDRVVQRLVDHPATQVVLDRDKANARQAGAVIYRAVSLAVLRDLRWSPVFAGADYPWGGF